MEKHSNTEEDSTLQDTFRMERSNSRNGNNLISSDQLHDSTTDEIREKRHKSDTTDTPSENKEHKFESQSETLQASTTETTDSYEEVTDQDNVYDIKKGLALVLWNTEFLKKDGKSIHEQSSREGIGNIDRENMGNVLPQYSIDIIGQKEFDAITRIGNKLKLENASGGNLLTQEAKDKIKEVQEEIEKRKPDVFICVISTHGQEATDLVRSNKQQSASEYEAHIVRHTLCFRDSLWDQKMYTEELVREFSDEKCPALKGKPRIFFIQACRSRANEARWAVEACEKSIKEAEAEIEACKIRIQNEEIEFDGRSIRIESEKNPAIVKENEQEIQKCKNKISREENVIKGYHLLIKEQTITLEACKKRLWEENMAMFPADISVTCPSDDPAPESTEKGKQEETRHRDKQEAKPDTTANESQTQQHNERQYHDKQEIAETNISTSGDSKVPLTQATSQMEQPQDVIKTDDISNGKEENSQQHEDTTDSNVQQESNVTTNQVFIKYEMTPSLCYKDCLIMYASPSGKPTYGRENIGGWMIDHLFKELQKNKSAEINLLDLLTRLSFYMVKEKTTTLSVETEEKKTIDFDFKVVPCLEHKLTKDVILKRRSKETEDKK